jgi:Thymidylate synthase complementing protein
MAAGGVAMEDLPQEELGRRDGCEQAVAPAGGARLLTGGLARIRVALGGPLRVAAREQARKDLPLSTYTEAYWKIDLHNLLHFLHLRMDEHAQREIRAYAIIGSVPQRP